MMIADGQSKSDDWPMFRHDAPHSGYTGIAPPASPVQLWNVTLESDSNSAAHLFNLSTSAPPVYPYSPAVAGGFVYVGTNDYTLNNYLLSCFSTTTGANMWCFSASDAITSTPAVVNGRVYVGSANGYVYCLSASNGTQIWNSSISGDTDDSADASITFADNQVIIESANGNIFCLGATDGGRIWNYSTGSHSDGACPAVSGGRVFAGNGDGAIFCLDASSGTRIWNQTIGGSVSAPAVVGGFVYVGSADGNVYCLNAGSGAKVWNYTTEYNSAGPSHGYHWGNSVSDPAVAGDRVYVGSSDFLVYCLNATSGSQIWNFTASAEMNAAPAVTDGCLLAGSYDGKLYCLNATDGKQIWNAEAGVFSPIDIGGSVGAPAVVDGTVYVVGNGVLQAYGTNTPDLKPTAFPWVEVTAGAVVVFALAAALIELYRKNSKSQKRT